ncbi:carboxymuconolactone decarboxylase family protein [Herbiconiux liukaitaii]|uniref:carboxymuconolactone decarboxylase family protein n=1 Tax=Herbiconiux liukaitaii TaxID=3342799 RepID=UPI0035BAB15A
MRRLEPLLPADLSEDQLALYSDITTGQRAKGPQHFALIDDDGGLAGPFNAFLLSPRLGSALQALGAAVRYDTALSARCREIAILVVAASWDSAFERDAHEAVGRAAGLTEAELEAIRLGKEGAFADPTETAVLELARAVSAGDLTDAEWARFASELGRRTVFDVSTLVGYYSTLALQLRIFRVTGAKP